MTKTETHCQVCGRAIKANTGRIAHHGYQRPGDGYQTRSCAGAKHVPYEIGHDALDSWISWLIPAIAAKTASLAAFQASPPAEFDVRERDSYGRYRSPTPNIKTRPDGFSGTEDCYASCIPRTYERQFWVAVRNQRRAIQQMKEALAYAQDRRAAWVGPK
jgi:hypothetical protein